MTNETKTKIKSTLRDFDFERVRKAMVAVNWTWGLDNTPTIEEMQEEAERLLIDIYEETDAQVDTVSCGGFNAMYNREEECFFLFFTIEEAWSHKWEELV